MRPPARLGLEHRQTLRPRATANELKRPPRYRRTLVDPFRDHLCRRRTEYPGMVRAAASVMVPVTRPLAEIRELGYTGSANVLVRYLSQAARTRSASRRHHASSSPG